MDRSLELLQTAEHYHQSWMNICGQVILARGKIAAHIRELDASKAVPAVVALDVSGDGFVAKPASPAVGRSEGEPVPPASSEESAAYAPDGSRWQHIDKHPDVYGICRVVRVDSPSAGTWIVRREEGGAELTAFLRDARWWTRFAAAPSPVQGRG